MPSTPLIPDPELCRMVVEHLKDHAMFEVDLNGFFSAWSPGVFWVFGFTEAEFVGQPVTLILPTEEDDQASKHPKRLKDIQTYTRDFDVINGYLEIQRWYICKNGSRFWGATRIVPLNNEGGELRSLFHIVRNDSSRHAMEEGLQHQNEQLQALSRSKDDFLATISHELRTPLQSILGWVQIIRQGGIDEATEQQALQTIEHSAFAQARLVEDLLDISRTTSGKLRLKVDTIDLSQHVAAVIESVKPIASQKSIEIQMNSTGQHFIMGDSARVEQIITNLLSNSIKFTQESGMITIDLAQGEKNIWVHIKDNGQGIEPDLLPYIFDPFRQGDSTDAQRHAGLGIGLALVRQLMELHGGTVTAKSRGEGTGALFILKFPSCSPDNNCNLLVI